MSKPFKFKHFTVCQDQCAMKIGTDAVLLGAWTPIEKETDSILDIGSGTGVIALQMAQRSSAMTIDAVEIDAPAHEQCVQNFERSPWNDRLFCYHASIQEFASEIEDKYDLIVSNPPFFSEDYKSDNKTRDVARFNDALPFDHLCICASHLLSVHGIFTVIIPRKEEPGFIGMAEKSGLFPNKICRVRGSYNSEEKRSMIVFSSKNSPCVFEELIIENSRHNYTEEYQQLVRDFYLKM